MDGSGSLVWNPWHGCHKESAGCAHCYVYRMDARYGRDSRKVVRTGEFDLPVRRDRRGGYVIPAGRMVYTCFSSDFLVEDADPWRGEAWEMMAQRQDLTFQFLTKRIRRLEETLPPDWGVRYDRVQVGCTVENQEMAHLRMPLFRDAPIRHKQVICEPLLGPIDLSPWLGSWVDGGVIAGGESGEGARPCRLSWILDLREQCIRCGIPFYFKQTGACFEKEGRLYHIPRKAQHAQARRAALDWSPSPEQGRLPWDIW